MTHEELIHVLEIGGDAAYRIFSETFKVFADYITQKNAEIKARDAEIRRLRTMIADHECSGVLFGEAYKRKPKKWVENRTTIQCPECGREFDDEVCCYEGYGWPWLCCPKCGARMEAINDA